MYKRDCSQQSPARMEAPPSRPKTLCSPKAQHDAQGQSDFLEVHPRYRPTTRWHRPESQSLVTSAGAAGPSLHIHLPPFTDANPVARASTPENHSPCFPANSPEHLDCGASSTLVLLPVMTTQDAYCPSTRDSFPETDAAREHLKLTARFRTSP